MRKYSIICGTIFIFFLLGEIYSQQNVFISSALSETQLNNPINANYEFDLVGKDDYYFSSYFIPSKFEMKELRTLGFFTSLPIDDESVVSLNVEGLGNHLFNQFSINSNFTHNFGDLFFLKVGIKLEQFVILNHNNFRKFLINFGAKIPVFSFLNIGFAFDNINRGYYAKDDFIEQTAVLSFGFNLFENLYMDINHYLNFDRDYSFTLVLSYEILELIKLRSAYGKRYNTFETGVQIELQEMGFIGMNFSINEITGLNSYYFLTLKL